MTVLFAALLWLVGAAVALYASEQLVHLLTELGDELHIGHGLLGFLVALGADAPEVTSALIAIASGQPTIGLGVILGSNVYNLAGLLGLSAFAARSIHTDAFRLVVDGGFNAILIALLVLLVFFPAARVALGACLLIVLATYAIALSLGRERLLDLLGRRSTESPQSQEEWQETTRPVPLTVALVVVSVVFIVGGSDLLVRESIFLGKSFGIPPTIVGTIVLAIATSLPNTWAAISLARRGLGRAAVSTALSSNSINAALGAGLPSLFVTVTGPAAVRSIDVPFLAGMTLLTIVFLRTHWSIGRSEGGALLTIYAGFVLVRLLAS